MKNRSYMICFLLFLIFIFSCGDKKTMQKNYKQNSFYDFEFFIEIIDERFGVVESFKYDGDNNLQKNVLSISHTYLKDDNIEHATIKISKRQMDSLFAKISNELRPNYLNNLDTINVPQPESYDDEWKICMIELDLKHRGGRYVKYQTKYKYFIKNFKLK